MTDLVKVAREGLDECRELGIEFSPAHTLIEKLCDEIVHLRRDVETFETLMKQRHKAVIDDMRVWLQNQGVQTVMAEKWLDAYAKDRRIENGTD